MSKTKDILDLSKATLNNINQLAQYAQCFNDQGLFAILDTYTTNLILYIYDRQMIGIQDIYEKSSKLLKDCKNRAIAELQKGTSLK